ncbi:hypothetical protein MycrhDRAFT_5626 [Mycolicibacterium rhodesiae JS60]|nr:hypothetical protein MycrhDRAFT_5626 [Mycolicibacterium rhodesiae JS60]
MGLLDQNVPNDDVHNVWVLALQGVTAKVNELITYALADNTDEGAEKVTAALAAAKPGEFVGVPIRFVNQADPTTIHIQPHLWGMWCLTQRYMSSAELFGGSPQPNT